MCWNRWVFISQSKKIIIRWLLACVGLLVSTGAIWGNQTTTDICILSSSEAGFTAAVQAARMGHQVILIEPTGHPGGMMVEGIVKDIRFGSSIVIGGIAREVYQALETFYGRSPNFEGVTWYCPYEPKVAEKTIEDLLAKEKNLKIIRGARLREKDGVIKRGTEIQQIILDNNLKISAKIFIDASIEGDLLHQAGIETETIREGNDRYQEKKNGIRTNSSYRQFEVDVDPYLIPGDANSGLIATVQDGAIGTDGEADKHIMGFCFRLCLTRDSSNLIPITKPEQYDPSVYEIYRRYLAAGGSLFYPRSNRANGKTDLGSWHDLSANLYGENWLYPTGTYHQRDSLVNYHRQFTHGLIWFLQNDPAVDSVTRARWEGWGLSKDEFEDNEGWPRRLYIRSCRRMVSDYIITEHHTYRHNPDTVRNRVAIAWWPPDTHHARRIVRNGKVYNEGFVFGDHWRPFGISYRALVPRRNECSNLITPTCPSSSYVAYGAIRILPTFMILGQSVGAAAALAIQLNLPVQDLPYDFLKASLKKSGQILEIPDDWEMRVDSEK